MKKMYKVWAAWQIIEAIILIAAGVFTIIFSNDPDLYQWIFIAIGSFIILDGILRVLIPFFNKDPKDNTLFIGVFELTFGIVMIIQAEHIVGLLMYFIGVLLFVIASVATADGVLRIVRKKEALFFPIFEFVASLVFIAVGVIVFIATLDKQLQNVVLIIVGAILILVAIFEIVITIKSLIKRKRKEKVSKETAPVKVKEEIKPTKIKKEEKVVEEDLEIIDVRAIPVKEEVIEDEPEKK